MSQYQNLASRAKSLLAQKGVTVRITKSSATTNPLTGEVVSSSEVDFTGYGVKGRFAKEEIDGSTVLGTDLKVIFEGDLPTEPEVGYTAVIGSKEYRIVNARPIEPADVAIVYVLQLRV
jgi:hypothetical protein